MALIGSGDSVSLVPESLVKNLQATVDTTERQHIMAANGNRIYMKGTVTLKVQIHDRTFTHEFYVMKEPKRGKHVPIFGNDFGRKAHLIVDQKGPAVYFWNELKQCLSQIDTENHCLKTETS